MAASLLAILLFAPGILSSWHSPPPVPASAPASKYVTTSIEELRVGDWVLARNPEVSEEERDEAGAIVPEQWRRIALRMEKPDGTGLEIELLRPADWLEDGEPQPGDIVWLDLAELGAEGEAEILAVGPCPALGPPPSPDCRVVTGTFAHQSAQVLDLSIEGLDLPLGVTANHPFWSEDRQEFLSAGELRPGERLLRADGFPTRLLAATPRPAAQPVYNIEVDVEHVYYVGFEGVLVHNSYSSGRAWLNAAKKWHDKRVKEIFGSLKPKGVGGRRYDAKWNGKDVEYKSDNFAKRTRSPEELNRMKTQIGKDIKNRDAGKADPHWHFEHNPRDASEMKDILKMLDDNKVPWTHGSSAPTS